MRPKNAKPSVCWYAPLQLLRTARVVAIATVFGQHADPRVIEAITRDDGSQRGARGTMPFEPHDYSIRPVPFWIDYVSDTGDGWDATYTVAYYLAQDELDLSLRTDDPSDHPAHRTRRGDILVLGGDEVYPSASLAEYETRLVLPYSHALPGGEGTGSLRSSPHVFAIPGNHDWYDSLVSFTRLFCTRSRFAGWEAQQQRSYFALKLPKGWWLIGTDLQLGSDIDGPQLAFFRSVEASIGPDDRIILCHAEPTWIKEVVYPNDYAYRSIRELESLFGDRVKLFLAGDYHHYSRHANGHGVHKIVAGGGGAFLHLTNGPDDRVLRGHQRQDHPQGRGGSGSRDEQSPFLSQIKYPSRWTSWWLAWTNLFFFPFRNWPLGFATAPAYMVTAAALISPDVQARSLGDLGSQILERLPWNPFSLFWVVSVTLGILFFTDTSRRWYRWSAGLIHAFAHILAAVLAGGAVAAFLQAALAAHAPRWLGWQPLLAAFATAAAGYVIGPLVLALYLTLSVNVFGRHRDDASSALRNPNYKNFLRLVIDETGRLVIFPVGITRVASAWARPTGSRPSLLEPRNGTRPFLIEEPIVIAPPPNDGTSGGRGSGAAPPGAIGAG